MTPLILRPEAEHDLAAARDWYDDQRPGLGRELLLEVSTVFDRIKATPTRFALLWDDIRVCRIRRFPYVVYYRALTGRTEVLAVLHGSRDDSAWRSRL